MSKQHTATDRKHAEQIAERLRGSQEYGGHVISWREVLSHPNYSHVDCCTLVYVGRPSAVPDSCQHVYASALGGSWQHYSQAQIQDAVRQLRELGRDDGAERLLSIIST